MSFAAAKQSIHHNKTSSPIRPKSAGATPQNLAQTEPVARSRSPTVKAPTPKQKIKHNDFNFNSRNMGNEVVVRMFEKLHETTGGAKKSLKADKTAQSNLRKLGTAPSEKILKNQMWKDFFCSEIKKSSEKEKGKGRDKKCDPGRPTTSEAEQHVNRSVDSNHDVAEENGNFFSDPAVVELDYHKLYHKMVRRVNQLWKELKIPTSDRDFYSVAIAKDKFRTVSQIDDLSCYIKRLLDHRKDTIRVTQAIRHRELVLDQLNSLLSLALRYFNAKYSTLHDDVARGSDQHGTTVESADKEERLKAEVRGGVRRIQQASCEVVRSIVAWRDALWRPQPFVFRGINYLVKMKTDMHILRSKSVQRVLASVPVEPSELLCVLFDESPGFLEVEPGGAVAGGGTTPTDERPLRGAQLEESIVLEDSKGDAKMSSDHVLVAPPAPEDVGIGVNGSDSGDGDGGACGMTGGNHHSLLAALVLVVTSEENVQRALQMESSALHARGAFIPSLRFELDDESDANMMRNKSE